LVLQDDVGVGEHSLAVDEEVLGSCVELKSQHARVTPPYVTGVVLSNVVVWFFTLLMTNSQLQYIIYSLNPNIQQLQWKISA